MSSVFNTTPQPLQIPGAAMWLDAADAATVGLSNNVVTRWRDKISGTVGTNIGNPIYSNVNGLPSVNFGGADYFSFGTSLLNIGTEPFTIFAVARNNTTSNVKGIIGRNTATPSWWVGYNSVNVQSQYTTAGGSINNFTTPNTATSNLGIIGLDVIRTTTQITTINYQNGSLLTPTVTSTYTSAAGAFTLFVGRGPGIFNLFGDICELIAYVGTGTTSAIMTAQRQFIEGYLTNKWGLQSLLPASHPYRNTFANNFGYQLDWSSVAEQSLVSFSNTPSQISGLALWLDGADAATVQFSSGANISNWRDKSGNGRNATQPTTSNQPTYSSNSVVFGQSLFLTTPLSASANTETIYMVTLLSNISYSSTILGQSNGSSGGRQFDIQYTANAGSCTARLIRMNQIFVNIASVPQPANVISLAEYTNNGTSSTIYWNGTAINTSVTPSAFSGTFTTAIGARGAILLDQFFYGSLFEILVYSNVLSTTDRQQVESYLAQKWGLAGSLPTSHLFKNNAYYNSLPIQNLTLQPTSQSLNSFIGFQPTSLSGLSLWLDGADPFNTGIQPSSGTLISTWSDKSGNGRNATVASNRVEGTYNTAFNCVYFQSSNVGYATSYSANPTVETMFIVANIDAPAIQNNNTVIGGERGARSFGFGWSGTPSAGAGFSSYLNNQIAWPTTAITGPSAGTTALITGTVSNTSNLTVALNGGASRAGTITAWIAGTTTYLAVDTTNRAYYYKGYVMEILFYNSVLTIPQRQQIEGYLAWKWGLTGSLPASHPNKNMPPN